VHRTSALRVADRYLRVKTGASKKRISGSQRNEYLDAVWDMYAKTYASIGLHIPSPSGLLKYGVWELDLGSDGKPIAFNAFKETPFGLKSGLAGHDGSSEGKRAAVTNLREKFKTSGVFGEVSHKVKDIAIAAGAPVVCAAYADDVTGKRIEIVGPVTYSRQLAGVGKVEKTLVGRPKGVPTTDGVGASCPLTNISLAEAPGRNAAGKVPSLLAWGDGLSAEEEAMYDLCSHCSDEAMSSII